MAKDRIRYRQRSVDDLDATFDYICRENPDTARKMLTSFQVSIKRLSTAPYLGAALRTDEAMLISSGYRYSAASPYLVFYRIMGEEIRIGRILHSRQDWLPLLFGIRSNYG